MHGFGYLWLSLLSHLLRISVPKPRGAMVFHKNADSCGLSSTSVLMGAKGHILESKIESQIKTSQTHLSP